MARTYKFAQKEYGIDSELLTFTGTNLNSFTYNGVPVMGQGSTLAVASAIGAVPNPAGLSVAQVGSVVTLTTQPANATNPGLLTTGTQTLAGAKTLTGATTLSGTTTLSGATTITAPLTVNAVSAFTNTLNVSGSLQVTGFPSTFTQIPSSPIVNPASAISKIVFAGPTGDLATAHFSTTASVAPRSATVQVCSLTPTSISWGSFAPANNVGISITGTKVSFSRAGSYVFSIKLQFTAGPTEWWMKMRDGPSGGTLTDTSAVSGISASAIGGLPNVMPTFRYDLATNIATDVDFTICAQSFPAGTFPSIAAGQSGGLYYTFIERMDLA